MHILSLTSSVKAFFADDDKLSTPKAIWKNPTFLISSAVALGITITVGVKWYRSWQNSLDQTIRRSFREIYPNLAIGDRAIFTRALLNNHWNQLELPECCRIPANREYLLKKLLIILENQQLTEEKITAALNMIRNFKNFMIESVNLIQHDLMHDLEFREIFEIGENPELESVEILGSESHERRSRGNNPLKISVGGRNIIFKPRSLIAEQRLCHTEESVFAWLNLPTYKIYNKNDQRYGYCEFLINEHTFRERDQIRELLLEHGKIEKVARHFGITDLHYENVFLSPPFPNRNHSDPGRPHLTDLEAILYPIDRAGYETHYLEYVATAGAWGGSDEGRPSNRYYFSEEFLQNINLPNDEHGFGLLQILHRLGGDLLNYGGAMHQQEHDDLTAFDPLIQAQAITDIRDELALHHHRIVLLPTEVLENFLDLPVGQATDAFIETLREKFTEFNFNFFEGEVPELSRRFQEDLLNCDVPIFSHYQGRFYYGECVFGTFDP